MIKSPSNTKNIANEDSEYNYNEEDFIKGTLFLSLSAPLVCFFSVITWAGFGSSIRIFISNQAIKKFIEILMAILLLLTAIFILI